MSDRKDIHCISESGPWPFVTRRVYALANDIESVWSSREHRKSLRRGLRESASWWWMPDRLNWWIGLIFALGSALFAVASVLSLMPSMAKTWSLESSINAIFFAGSIPFTIAAWLQLYQAANAPINESTSIALAAPKRRLVGWRPHDAGWLSCALQFAGTILFNFNTFDAMIPSLNWFQQDLAIWLPNIVGSVLFLISGYLGFIEACHAHWAFRPKDVSWWVVFTNLLGCIGFMVSAVFAVVLSQSRQDWTTASTIFTLLGAVFFFAGSLLMLPEAFASKPCQNETTA